MLTKVDSGALYGVDVKPVSVEVGCHDSEKFNLMVVGLPDAVIRESRERVMSALGELHCFVGTRTILVSLAPADLRKSGSLYDLPIAVGMIASTSDRVAGASLRDTLLVGELGLDGCVRPIRGALAFAMLARDLGKKYILVPKENAREASAVKGISVIGVRNLAETVAFLSDNSCIAPTELDLGSVYADLYRGVADFVDVKGQELIKRAVTVAAAGNHHLLMVGEPGTGKSMIAKRIPGILPPLSFEESMEVTKIHSIAGTLDSRCGLLVRRPFRDPHHTVSDAGLVGGQSIPRPGELSLAHCGVLFLDELPEFRRNALEVLRQPLENGQVTLSRASGSFVFPARVMLVAAMNPCPCGYFGSQTHFCRCNPLQIKNYRSRISGPLLDRLDVQVEVSPLTEELLLARRAGENSASMREKVRRARLIQAERYRGTGIRDNASLSGKRMDDFCALSPSCQAQMRAILQSLRLSARAYDRILRVARTIADLDGGGPIQEWHLQEAAGYRLFDRQQDAF